MDLFLINLKGPKSIAKYTKKHLLAVAARIHQHRLIRIQCYIIPAKASLPERVPQHQVERLLWAVYLMPPNVSKKSMNRIDTI